MDRMFHVTVTHPMTEQGESLSVDFRSELSLLLFDEVRFKSAPRSRAALSSKLPEPALIVLEPLPFFLLGCSVPSRWCSNPAVIASSVAA